MSRSPTIALLIAALLLPGAVSAGGAIARPATETASPALDEATQRALDLEQAIEDHRSESIALEERIAVTNMRILVQQDVLADARRELQEANHTYRSRIVSMYKSRVNDPITILLTADTMSDFYTRLLMLSRIAQRDRHVLESAAIAAAEAEFQANYLDDLKAQDIALRQILRQTRGELDRALDEQQALVARLTEESQRVLQVRRDAHTKTRAEWLAASVPLDDPVAKVPGVVEPYTDRVYLVSEYHPRRYRSLGITEYAFCSWYGNEFHGRMTACGQIYNQNDFTTASRTLPFGTRLALTRGDRRIVVVVTDRGPFIAGRDLDLSRAAAEALGFSGLATVHVEYVEAIDP